MDLATLKSRARRRLDETGQAVRYTDVLLTQAANDGIELFMARTNLDVAQVVITQQPGTLWYDLPAECIRVQSVRRVADNDPLLPIDYRDLDDASPGRARYRWGTATDHRATHYLIFGLRELGLWPLLGSATQLPASPTTTMDEAVISQGASFLTLASAPVGGAGVYVNGVRLARVSIPTAANEYALAGSAIVFGDAPAIGDVIEVTYQTALTDYVLEAALSGAGSSWVLPAGAVTFAIFFNGLRQTRVVGAPGANEYSVSGNSVLTGEIVLPGDSLVIDYTTTGAAHTLGASPAGARDGINTTYALSATPARTQDLAVFLNGARLSRATGEPSGTEYLLTANLVRVADPLSAADSLVADFVIPGAAPSTETYTVTYSRDVGEAAVDSDADELPFPVEYDHFLLDYVVGRMLLPGARQERLAAAKVAMSRFTGAIAAANSRQANMARLNKSEGQVLR